MSHARLAWQCRRGSLELDTLLTSYLQQRYDQAPMDEQDAFAALLELDDISIMAYLNGREQPQTDALSRLVKHIQSVYPHTFQTKQN